jgi:Raf kinase inhibitor-like YbhB/YbcL family protein
MRRVSLLVVGLLITSAACSSTSGPAAAPPKGTADSSAQASGFRLTSPDFVDGGKLDEAQSCQGAGTAPALAWTGVPKGTTSLTLVVFDPDAGSDGFVHWVIGGLDPTTGKLDADAIPNGAVQANNGAGKAGWTPPCPPSGDHRYQFTLYALDGPTRITPGEDPQKAIADTKAAASASTTLTGRYQKS